MRTLLVLGCAVALLLPVASLARGTPTALTVRYTADSARPNRQVR